MEKEFTLKLSRNLATSEAKQTLGKMILFENLNQIFDCLTLELPWKNNATRISCISVGEYECEKVPATASIPYEHILIKDVPGRSGICIHFANYYLQLRGCIAVGDGLMDMNYDGEFDVKNSSKTFKKLMEFLPDQFTLIIN